MKLVQVVGGNLTKGLRGEMAVRGRGNLNIA